MQTKEFRVNDVYLVEWASNIKIFTIYEICDRMVKHNFGWENIEDFAKRVKAKYGVRKHFWFISWIAKVSA